MNSYMKSRDEVIHIQNKHLKRQLERIYNNSPFYRKKMDTHGILPGDIRDLDDLRKYTTKDEIIAHNKELFAVSMKQIQRLQSSSGTIGNYYVAGYTKTDLEIWSSCVAASLEMAGLDSRDILQVAFNYGLFTGGLGFHYGGERLGMAVIPTSTGSTSRQLDFIEKFQSTVLACTPSYFSYLTEEMRKRHIQAQSLKVAFLGAEAWGTELRERLQSQYNIELFDIYGLTEILGPGVACECGIHDGLHVFEEHFYPEVVGIESEECCAEGEVGELVLTTLTKEATPLIRYKTRDKTSITYKRCECGRVEARIAKITGRIDDMLIIKGVNIYPQQVETILLRQREFSSNYILVVEREAYLDMAKIFIELESQFQGLDDDKRKEIIGITERMIKQELYISISITIVPEGTIKRSDGKAKRVIDRRKCNA